MMEKEVGDIKVKDISIKGRIERRWLYRALIIFVPAFVSMILFFLVYSNAPDVFFNSQFMYELGKVGAFGFLAISGFVGMLVYLQRGFGRVKFSEFEVSRNEQFDVDKLRIEIRNMRNAIMHRSPNVKELEAKVAALRERILDFEQSAVDLTDDQRSKLIESIKSKLEHDAATSVLEEIRTQALEAFEKNTQTEEIEKYFRKSKERLVRELADLSR